MDDPLKANSSKLEANAYNHQEIKSKWPQNQKAKPSIRGEQKKEYNHQEIEKKWQDRWQKSNIYKAPEQIDPDKKLYVLPQLPYPSGSGLHVGHAEGYTACDIYARSKRMQGKQVLQAIGWDSFGLPAENYAIKHNVHPKIKTQEAIDSFRSQLKRMGMAIDWSREVGSHQPEYYKWTQWFFLLMYERGLAYRKKQTVNWCPSCQTVLANEQVIKKEVVRHLDPQSEARGGEISTTDSEISPPGPPNGRTQGRNDENQTEISVCERCDTEIELKQMEQWYLKITDYADRLYDDLDKVDWPPETVINQRNWIGRKTGAEITFKLRHPETTRRVDEGSQSQNDRDSSSPHAPQPQNDNNNEIQVFTTRPDTLYGVTFIVIAPELAQEWINACWQTSEEVQKYVKTSLQKTELQRQTEEKSKTGIDTGITAIHPLTGDQIPVYVADYVLMDYGTGAVMGVPAHDERDFEFAKKYGLEIVPVIRHSEPSNDLAKNPQDKKVDSSSTHELSQNDKLPYSGPGTIINSGDWNGLSVPESMDKILTDIEAKKVGQRQTTFRLRDWSVSRQRFWGAPIPMLYRDRSGIGKDQGSDPGSNTEWKPVPIDDLPVKLPDDVDFKPTGVSPLTYSEEFQKGVEQKYGKGWHREVDTLDTFMCSSWYYFRYIDPHNSGAFASQKALKNWMPVDFYIGGPEHTNGHLLYSRFFTKVLYDAGIIDFDEPFLLHRHQGLILGEDNRKMSKRWGNVINPSDVVDRHGADTLRLYEMFMGPLTETKAWNTNGEAGIYRFLNKIWRLQFKVDPQYQSEEQTKLIHQTIKYATQAIDRLAFNTTIAKYMELINFLTKEKKVSGEVWTNFLLILAPFAPHITEELWQSLASRHSEFISESSVVLKQVQDDEIPSIHLQPWPSYVESLTQEDTVEIPVQVNGKLRATLTLKAKSSKLKAEVEQQALSDPNISKWVENKPIRKTIFIPGKLLNFVV